MKAINGITKSYAVISELGIVNNKSIDAESSYNKRGYFYSFKEPIKQLKLYIDEFNKNEDINIHPLNADRVANLSIVAEIRLC